MVAGGGGDTPVAREERGIERLRHRDIGGVASGESAAQIPEARQQEVVAISLNGKVGQIIEGGTAALDVDFPRRRVAANDLRHLDVEQDISGLTDASPRPSATSGEGAGALPGAFS